MSITASLILSSPGPRSGRGPDGVWADKQQLQQPGAVEGGGKEGGGVEPWYFSSTGTTGPVTILPCAGAEYKYQNPVVASLDLQNPRHSHAGRISLPHCGAQRRESEQLVFTVNGWGDNRLCGKIHFIPSLS